MDPKGQPTVVIVRRRRRTRRHRRNRSLRRAALLALIVGVLLGFWVSQIPEDFGSYIASVLPSRQSAVSMNEVRAQLAPQTAPPPSGDGPGAKRDVYPYSLVPGGVRDAKELRDVFEHDPVLASHYRDFDFRHARVVRLLQDKTVYVSYRIGGKIYWTTRRVNLHAGEVLITDGVITVRSRCGNQVSVNPRHEVSPNEPNLATLDRPMRFFDPQGPVGPAPNVFESSMQRPSFPAFSPPPPAFPMASANSYQGGFIYPPNPDTCAPTPPRRKPGAGGSGGSGGSGGGSNGKKKKKGNPCSPGGGGVPGTTPEPASLILLSTGLGGIYFRYRQQRARAAKSSLLAH